MLEILLRELAQRSKACACDLWSVRHVPVTYGLSSIHICSFKQPQFSLYKLSKGSMDLMSRKDIKLSEVPCLRGDCGPGIHNC